MKISQHIAIWFVVISAVLCLDVQSSQASFELITVKPPIHHVAVYMDTEQQAVFAFDSPIFDVKYPKNWKVDVLVDGASNTVTLEAKPGVKLSDLRGQVTVVTQQYKLLVGVQPAEDASKIRTAFRVVNISVSRIMDLAVEKLADEKTRQKDEEHKAETAALKDAHAEELKRERAAHAKELKRAQNEHGESVLLNEVPDGYRKVTRLRGSRSCDKTDKGVAICGKQWTPMKEYGVLQMLVTNRTKGAIDLRKITAHNEHGTRDHASMVRIGDNPPVPSSNIKNAKLASGESVPVSVSIRSPKRVGKQLRVMLAMADGLVPAFTTIDLDPEPEEGEGLITLGLQGIAGAVWLANPMEPSALDATSTAGLEMRVRYGFNQRWSFEATLAGAKTGNARFDGMMYENQEGEIARNAMLGRLLLGGVLHFGDKYRPMVRAGLGFQGVDHGSRFIPTTGADREGPGEGFAADGLYYLGLGFEASIGRHWTAGVGASLVGVAKNLSGTGLSGSVEGGFHLSYGWTPRY